MSVTVTHVNADTTFLLTFRPAASPYPLSPGPSSGTFSILLDPWLEGPSTVFHTKFSTARHTVPASISSLSDLPPPNLVVISQEKPDHCHEETLRQLPPGDSSKTLLLAAPNAAKRIRAWKHFSPSRVHSLAAWNPTTKKVQRFPLSPTSPNGTPGEVSVAYMPRKQDITGVHGAIGITYRPPSSRSPFQDFPMSPPGSPASFLSQNSSYAAPQDRAISIIYSPHGCPYSLLRQYAIHHLVKESALPLTALMHSFDRVQNPWWLGGNISHGLPGGLEIARGLQARCWIGAHDEEKDVGGVTASLVRTRKFGPDEVNCMLEGQVEVLNLGVGESWAYGWEQLF